MTNLIESENPEVQRHTRRCQLYEITLLLGLMLLICGFFVFQDNKWLLVAWSVACSVLAAASLRATVHNYREALRICRTAQFVVSPRRLATLSAVKAPEDVTDYLKTFQARVGGGKFFRKRSGAGDNYRIEIVGEGRFFRKLEQDLGSERTREVKSLIFKYVKA